MRSEVICTQAEGQKTKKVTCKMWHEGTIRIGGTTYKFCVKVYDEPSEYGINEGRISKAEIRRNSKTVYHYERGLDTPPADKETELALARLLKKYN